MKTIYSIAALFLLSTYGYTQVGINNTLPQATLDITSKTTDGSRPEGLIAPRLTGDQIKAADAQYTASQTGTIIYATAAVGTVTTKTANITSAGYYFFDGSVWQKVSGGDTTNDAWVNDVSNTMVKLGTQSDASTARVAGTEFVSKDNGNVGIGTNAPQGLLDVSGTGTNAMFIPPRLTTVQRNALVNPPAGAIIYNTNSGTGALEMNYGTPSTPDWRVPLTSSAASSNIVLTGGTGNALQVSNHSTTPGVGYHEFTINVPPGGIANGTLNGYITAFSQSTGVGKRINIFVNGVLVGNSEITINAAWQHVSYPFSVLLGSITPGNQTIRIQGDSTVVLDLNDRTGYNYIGWR